jgi:hypothetical protein
MNEMDLTLTQAELDAAARRDLARIAGVRGRGRCPLENPDVKPITEELLIAPHPDEPGVTNDGSAAPLENPGN